MNLARAGEWGSRSRRDGQQRMCGQTVKSLRGACLNSLYEKVTHKATESRCSVSDVSCRWWACNAAQLGCMPAVGFRLITELLCDWSPGTLVAATLPTPADTCASGAHGPNVPGATSELSPARPTTVPPLSTSLTLGLRTDRRGVGVLPTARVRPLGIRVSGAGRAVPGSSDPSFHACGGSRLTAVGAARTSHCAVLSLWVQCCLGPWRHALRGGPAPEGGRSLGTGVTTTRPFVPPPDFLSA